MPQAEIQNPVENSVTTCPLAPHTGVAPRVEGPRPEPLPHTSTRLAGLPIQQVSREPHPRHNTLQQLVLKHNPFTEQRALDKD